VQHLSNKRPLKFIGKSATPEDMKINNQKVHYVVNSVNAYAFVLDKCMKDNDGSCNLSSQSFSEMVRNEVEKFVNPTIVISKYRIKDNGQTGYEQIGECDSTSEVLDCNNINTNVTAGGCTKNQVLHRDPNHNSDCPKICMGCKSNQYMENNSCIMCNVGSYVNHSAPDGAKCYKLDTDYPLTLDSPAVIILWCLTFLGLICIIIVIVIFLIYRKTPVVMITHGYKPLLLGLIILYLDTFVELERPSTIVCTFRRFIFGIGLTTVYGALFMRALSRYRIQNALLEERKSHFAQVQTQRLLLLLLITLQLVISVIWCLLKSPHAITEWTPGTDIPGIEKCNTDELARFFSQTYNFILITVCTYYALRTRKVEGAFDESKWIFYALSSNWVVGLIFAAVHYSNLQNYAVARVALCFTTTISAFLILFFVFLPKIYIILFRPDLNVMCDDMEELNCSISESVPSSRHGSFVKPRDSSKNMETKTMPKLTFSTPDNKDDAIERVDSKDDGKDEKPLSTVLSSPERTLLSNQLPKEVIVHSPE
jgi:hypothetical protein